MPLLGYLPFLSQGAPQLKLTALKAKFGDVVQLRLGGQRAVVLNSFPVIKEALGKWEFADRPHTYTFQVTTLLQLDPQRKRKAPGETSQLRKL